MAQILIVDSTIKDVEGFISTSPKYWNKSLHGKGIGLTSAIIYKYVENGQIHSKINTVPYDYLSAKDTIYDLQLLVKEQNEKILELETKFSEQDDNKKQNLDRNDEALPVILKMKGEGATGQAIADYLNENGYVNSRGNRWLQVQVNRILHRAKKNVLANKKAQR